MANIRISAIKKELNIESKEILDALEAIGIKDKKPQSSITIDEANNLMKAQAKWKDAIKGLLPEEENSSRDTQEGKSESKIDAKKETKSEAISKEEPKNKTSEQKESSKTKEETKPTKEEKEKTSAAADNASKAQGEPKKKLKFVFRRENTKEGERKGIKPVSRSGAGASGLGVGKLKPSQIASLKKEREEKKRRELEAKKKQELELQKKKELEKNQSQEDATPLVHVEKVEKKESVNNTPETVIDKPVVEVDTTVDMPSEKASRQQPKQHKKDKTDRHQQQDTPKNKRKGRKDQQIYDDTQTHRKLKAKPKQEEVEVEEEPIKLISIQDTITIQELADKMKIKASKIVKDLFLKGQVVTLNQEIDFETAENLAIEYDVLVEHEKVEDIIGKMLEDIEESEDVLKKRPPVVCVMGHVDHGKTSLLDAIRNTNVIDREAGGITQHIGAYMVECNGEPITFLDTPGHEAFTAMRLRGAKSTDIAVLVVAADDGVMPQTVEAIDHAKAAEIEIIVAINKIDKPGADPNRVKQELTEYGLIPEEWGGSTVFCEISAKQNKGIDNLLEMILLTAEVLELKANPDRNARGVVIEAKIDKGRGPVATLLVQKGTLKKGDNIASGGVYGKIRAMIDNRRKMIDKATPSMPVEILGLNGVPKAGDVFIQYDNEKDARALADAYNERERINKLSENKSKLKMSLDDLYSQIQEGQLKELCLIIKGDVQGSVEAMRQSLEKISNEEVVVKIIHRAVGNISESDISLASASNAIIIGFNVKIDTNAKAEAEEEGVDIRLYNVIYNAIEDVQNAINGMLAPEYEEKVTGHVEVRQLFKASAVGIIAGGYVTDGVVDKDSKVRVYRDGDMVFEGELTSLKRFKDDVKEVKQGFECGLVIEEFQSIKEGDTVEAYKMVEVPR